MKSLAAILSLSALLLLTACRPSPQKLLATGNKYHENKKYKEADILYQKVIAKDKTNAEAYYREGLNLLDEGDPVQAASFLRRAVDLKPTNSDATSKLAEIYLTAYASNPQRLKNLLPEIIDLKNRMLQQNPNSFDGLRIQGLIALTDHKLDEAAQSFEKANQIQPYSRKVAGWYAQTLALQGKPDQARTLITQTLAHDKTWAGGYMFLFGEAVQNHDQPREEAILRERLQNNPKDPAATIYLADFLLSTNRFDEAEGVMKRVLNDKTDFPAGHQMMGDFYSRAKRYDQAIAQYQEGAQDDSKNALKYQQRIVTMYVLQNQHDKALAMARDLAAQNPKDNLTNETYASLLLQTGLASDAQKSLAELKNLVQKDPSNPLLHLDLGRAYLLTNHPDNAMSETTEALQEEVKSKTPRNQVIQPGRLMLARIYEQKGQHAQSLEQTQQVLQADPNSREAHLLRDEALIGLGQTSQARPDLEALVAELDKQNLQNSEANQARLLLGQIYVASREFPKAIAEFTAVWKSNPPDMRGFEALQEVSIRQGKPDDAVAAMTNMVNSNPADINLRFDLASMQFGYGDQLLRSNQDHAKALFQAAAENFKQVLKSNPKATVVWTRLAQVQTRLGQSDAALASYEQAISADPSNSTAQVNRGELFEALGRKKEAADAYNKVLGIDPDNAIALNNLAMLNADQNINLEQAQSYAERAKKRYPHSPDISDTLGYVYMRRNLNSAAVSIFRQDVQEHPENAIFHLHLAMALLKQGDKQGAKEEAAKALKIAPPAQQEQIKSFASQIG